MRHMKDRKPTATDAPARATRASGNILATGLGALGGIVGVSVVALSALPALAQGDYAVDVTDPNVSVDLSVLEDGGLTPHVTAPMPTTSGPPVATGGFRAPGPKPPVSTLYIQPSDSFTLPPQTKTLIAKPAPADIPAPPEEPETELAVETPAPEPAPEQAAELPAPPAMSMPAPVETAKSAPRPTLPEPPEVATPEPAPKPAQEMAKAEPELTPEPTPAPKPMKEAPQEVAKAEPTPPPRVAPPAPQVEAPAPQAETPAPPPPPQVLTASKPPSVDETQTAQQPKPLATPPATSSNAVVVDLPPKTEAAGESTVASLPPATGALSDGDNMRIVFEHDSSKLPADARDALLALSERLNQQDNLRLQLLAYAGDANTSASAARRLSLSRALAVRSFLIENGVRSTRIDVRALGNKSTEAVTERVDITVVER